MFTAWETIRKSMSLAAQPAPDAAKPVLWGAEAADTGCCRGTGWSRMVGARECHAAKSSAVFCACGESCAPEGVSVPIVGVPAPLGVRHAAIKAPAAALKGPFHHAKF